MSFPISLQTRSRAHDMQSLIPLPHEISSQMFSQHCFKVPEYMAMQNEFGKIAKNEKTGRFWRLPQMSRKYQTHRGVNSSQHFRGWKMNNWTSAIHYALSVTFNYSLLVLLVIPISSC